MADEMKKVMVRHHAYYDGVRKHEPGTVLLVPLKFGMTAKRDPSTGEKVKDKNGNVVMTESDNFPIWEPGMEPSTSAAPFGDGKNDGLDPNLGGVPPTVVSAPEEPRGPSTIPSPNAPATPSGPVVPNDPSADNAPPSPKAAAAAAKG